MITVSNITKGTGIINQSDLDNVLDIYLNDGDVGLALDLAVATMTIALGGTYKCDDKSVKRMLRSTEIIAERNIIKYENRIEARIRTLQLREIVDLLNKGMTQKKIGELLGLTQQDVSYRIKVINTEFPDLQKIQKIQKKQRDVNVNVNVNVNDNVDDNININENINGDDDSSGVSNSKASIIQDLGF